MDHGADIWTGPFMSEEESRSYAFHWLGSYDAGSNKSAGRSIIPEPTSDTMRIQRNLKLVLSDLETILEDLANLQLPKEDPDFEPLLDHIKRANQKVQSYME